MSWPPIEMDAYLNDMERQVGLWGPEAQEKIRGATVAVGGVGGIGAISALMLAKAGVGDLRICDRDHYGPENIVEQAFATWDTRGRPKVETALAEMARHTRHTELSGFLGDLSREEDAMRLIEGADVLISGVDNAPARMMLGRICARLAIPMVVSANVGWCILHTVYMPGEGSYASVWHGVTGVHLDAEGFPDMADPDTRQAVEDEWAIWVAAMAGFEPEYLKRYIDGDRSYLWYAAPPAYFAASLGVMDALKIITGKGRPTGFPAVFYFDMKTGVPRTWNDFDARRQLLREAWNGGAEAVLRAVSTFGHGDE
jgi:molybdopterin/thiamine biosynthesis adenylyltransferase